MSEFDFHSLRIRLALCEDLGWRMECVAAPSSAVFLIYFSAYRSR